jgi:acyl carrier protein
MRSLPNYQTQVVGSRIAQDLEDDLEETLSRPGLQASLSPGVKLVSDGAPRVEGGAVGRGFHLAENLIELLHDEAGLRSAPALEWPAELLALWTMGAIYLHDQAAGRLEGCVCLATRLVLRGAHVMGPGALEGDGLLFEESHVGPNFHMEGPVVLLRSRIQSHCQLGPWVRIVDSGIAPFARLASFVDVRASTVGSYSMLFGGQMHLEMYPVGPSHDEQAVCVMVGPHAWIGSHVIALGGTRMGEGSVAVTGAVLNHDFGPFVLASGAPARALPIDFNLRQLDGAACHQAGLKQGPLGMQLPAFGPATVALVAPDLLELDYPKHGVLGAALAPQTLEFHRGAILAALRWLIPDCRVEVSVELGQSVRFHARFARAIGPRARITDDLVLAAVPSDSADALSPAAQAVLELLQEGPLAVAEIRRQLRAASMGEPSLFRLNESELLELSQRDLVSPRLLPALARLFPLAKQGLAPLLEALAGRPAELGEFHGADSVKAAEAVPAVPRADSAVEVEIAKVLSEVLKLPVEKIGSDASIKTLDGWDSLSHVNVIVALEERFGREFRPDEYAELNSIEAIARSLRRR